MTDEQQLGIEIMLQKMRREFAVQMSGLRTEGTEITEEIRLEVIRRSARAGMGLEHDEDITPKLKPTYDELKRRFRPPGKKRFGEPAEDVVARQPPRPLKFKDTLFG